MSCFEKLKSGINNDKSPGIKNPMVKELAVVDVYPGKNNKPDMFFVLIKGDLKEVQHAEHETDHNKKFMVKWSFIRQWECGY